MDGHEKAEPSPWYVDRCARGIVLHKRRLTGEEQIHGEEARFRRACALIAIGVDDQGRDVRDAALQERICPMIAILQDVQALVLSNGKLSQAESINEPGELTFHPILVGLALDLTQNPQVKILRNACESIRGGIEALQNN